jgi:hypothetical protein
MMESPREWLMLQYEHRLADDHFIPGTAVVRPMAQLLADHPSRCPLCGTSDWDDEAWTMRWKGTRTAQRAPLPV